MTCILTFIVICLLHSLNIQSLNKKPRSRIPVSVVESAIFSADEFGANSSLSRWKHHRSLRFDFSETERVKLYTGAIGNANGIYIVLIFRFHCNAHRVLLKSSAASEGTTTLPSSPVLIHDSIAIGTQHLHCRQHWFRQKHPYNVPQSSHPQQPRCA